MIDDRRMKFELGFRRYARPKKNRRIQIDRIAARWIARCDARLFPSRLRLNRKIKRDRIDRGARRSLDAGGEIDGHALGVDKENVRRECQCLFIVREVERARVLTAKSARDA